MNISHLYLLFLILGSLGLLSSLIFGEMHHDVHFGHGMDFGHGDSGHADSPRIFSLRVIFSFLLAFSIGGGSLYLNHEKLPLQILVGMTSGVLTGVGIWGLMKWIYGFQGESNIDSSSFVGKIAFVTIGTTNMGLAQVKLDSQGGDQLFMAQEESKKELFKNDKVKVVDRNGTTLIVQKL
jgi:membrane protein implicated in regulation of membrane protease activity